MEVDDARRFDAIVAPLVKLLLRYFGRRVEPIEDASDCTSETLLVLWRHRRRMPHSEDERRAWAYGIARRVLSNYRRGRIRGARRDERLRAAVTAPSAEPIEEALAAREALSRLAERDQEIVKLVIWDDLSVIDASRILGISAGTARARYARALGRLRAIWNQAD